MLVAAIKTVYDEISADGDEACVDGALFGRVKACVQQGLIGVQALGSTAQLNVGKVFGLRGACGLVQNFLPFRDGRRGQASHFGRIMQRIEVQIAQQDDGHCLRGCLCLSVHRTATKCNYRDSCRRAQNLV